MPRRGQRLQAKRPKPPFIPGKKLRAEMAAGLDRKG